MNQSQLTQLITRLPLRINARHKKFSNPEGLLGRLKIMRKTVTALIRHERLEINFPRADEARPYAERLISEALRYGDTHQPTMKLADFWIEDKALIPKLFKVLAPRYQDWPSGLPYTRMLRAPSSVPSSGEYDTYRRAVLELRGNPYPPLPGPVNLRANPNLIHNVLLEEARKDYFNAQSKTAQLAEEDVLALPEIDNAHCDTPEVSNESSDVEKEEVIKEEGDSPRSF